MPFYLAGKKKHQLPSPQYRPPHELGVGRLSIWLCSGSNCQSTGGPPKWNLIKLCWPYLVGLSQYIVGLSQYVIIQLLYYSNPLIMLLDYHPTTSVYIYKAISENIVCQKILTKMGIYLKIPYSIYCRKFIVVLLLLWWSWWWLRVWTGWVVHIIYIMCIYIYVITI